MAGFPPLPAPLLTPHPYPSLPHPPIHTLMRLVRLLHHSLPVKCFKSNPFQFLLYNLLRLGSLFHMAGNTDIMTLRSQIRFDCFPFPQEWDKNHIRRRIVGIVIADPGKRHLLFLFGMIFHIITDNKILGIPNKIPQLKNDFVSKLDRQLAFFALFFYNKFWMVSVRGRRWL